MGTKAHSAADRLREFLLEGAAQQRAGSHAGAVAGTTNGSAVSYVYGEITGYYLHWLGSLPMPKAAHAAQAEAAAAWLEKYLHTAALPLTRIYLGNPIDDWRNNALFAFDLAMIAGGVARAVANGLLVLRSPLTDALQNWLQHFVDGEQLKTCIVRDTSTTMPSRWSTQGGSFTAKTASRILLLSHQTPMPRTLVDACTHMLTFHATAAEHNGLDMLHPTLYAIEGCLLAPDADYEKLARWFDQIVHLQAPDGSLPESLQTPDIRRTDIIAQALRVAVFLQRLTGQPMRYAQANRKFASVLCARLRTDGSLGFTPDSADANIWCAMFAEQALRLYSADMRDRPLPFGVEDLV